MTMTNAPELKAENNPSGTVQTPLTIRQILAPTNLRDGSQKALNYATRFAQYFGAKLTLIHIYEEPFIYGSAMSPETAQELRKARQGAENALLAICEEMRAEYPKCDTYFQCGQPHELIVAAAKELNADLIVLSTHDYRWLNHLLFGSDAEAILHHAPCPVLVVHEHERDFVGS
jgi:universal stress protein A